MNISRQGERSNPAGSRWAWNEHKQIWVITCSFCILATADLLLGWMLEDVADGQPFCIQAALDGILIRPAKNSPRQATASCPDRSPETTRYQPTQGAKTVWLYEAPRQDFRIVRRCHLLFKKIYWPLTGGRCAVKKRQNVRTNHRTHIFHNLKWTFSFTLKPLSE